jgi:hypothetical protein
MLHKLGMVQNTSQYINKYFRWSVGVSVSEPTKINAIVAGRAFVCPHARVRQRDRTCYGGDSGSGNSGANSDQQRLLWRWWSRSALAALHQVVNRTSLVCLPQHQVTAAVLRSSRALHVLQRGETQALLQVHRARLPLRSRVQQAWLVEHGVFHQASEILASVRPSFSSALGSVTTGGKRWSGTTCELFCSGRGN